MVRVVTRHGRIVDVLREAAGRARRRHPPGRRAAGLANAHSHAFHRALRGRTHDDGGNFWTWRDAMYAVTHRLDPETLHALAKAVFAEMLLAGYTTVGEFHYVHHAPGGRRYDDPNVMGKALLSAAREAGIRITLLDTCYLAGGLTASGHVPLDEAQERFSDGTVDAWASRVDDLSGDDTARIGTAVHSVRAVPCDDLAAVGEFAAREGRPLHVHLSEQPGENLACDGFYGCSPTELLSGEGLLAPTTTVVHATHLSDKDVQLLAGARTTACFCPRPSATSPTASARPGACTTREWRSRSAPTSRRSSTRSRAARRRDARAPREHGARRFGAGDLLAMGTQFGYCSLGWDDGGLIATGHLADLVAVRLDSPRTAGRAPDACSTPRRRPTSATSSSTANGSSPGGSTAPATSAELLADAIAAVRR